MNRYTLRNEVTLAAREMARRTSAFVPSSSRGPGFNAQHKSTLVVMVTIILRSQSKQGTLDECGLGKGALLANVTPL